jgi:hypothetical protein
MGRDAGHVAGKRNALAVSVETPKERRVRGRYTYRRGCEDNIKIDVKEID